jgi:DnaJ-class molecular chaperone
VKIPPGIESGAKLRLRGQGEAGEKGGPRGDLTILVTVEPHPYFTREGRNLIVEVPITVSEAILGARIDVPTLDGKKALTIPPGTSSGQKLRLRGQGVPASGGKPEGDLLLVIKIVVPKNVDETSRKLISEFAERNPQNPREGTW